jgi:hypothetical protein
MATYCIPRDPLTWFVVGARRVLLSACAVALVSCGGGQGEPATPVESVGPTLPAQLVVGTAQSIDSGASGDPLTVRVARSANGDGFAVWLAASTSALEEIHHSLWANRYIAATAAWGSPIKLTESSQDHDLAVDASGNAVVVWHLPSQSERGVVMSVRFDAGAGAWATPVPLNTNASEPRVASDATGAVLAVYLSNQNLIRGRFFDPASGTWQPEAAIQQSRVGSGAGSSVPILDGNGNALVAFPAAVPGIELVASNYFSRSTGDWVFQLSPDQCELVVGEVPGSAVCCGQVLLHLALTTSSGGDFLMAWQSFERPADIRIARFTSSTRTWSEAQTLVPDGIQNVSFGPNGFGSDAAGNALVLWTEDDGLRRVLKAIRVDPTGAASSAAQVIDGAVGGGAVRADLAFDPTGHAIAVWWQFEGARGFDGSRSNIAMNRFDGATGTWGSAVFAEMQPGDVQVGPLVSANGGQALLGWIQVEGGVNRVKALLQPLTNTPSQ